MFLRERVDLCRRPPTRINPSLSRNGFKLASLPLVTACFPLTIRISFANVAPCNLLKIRVSASFISSLRKDPRCLFVRRNRRQYATMRVKREKEEYLWKSPRSSYVTAKHMLVLSSGSWTFGKISLGHSLASFLNHGGLETHDSFLRNACGNWPLEIASAGLSLDLT